MTEAIHDVLVVHDFVEHVDRRIRRDFQELIDDIDRHVDAGAEASWISQDEFHWWLCVKFPGTIK
jgi:hypothetical protein